MLIERFLSSVSSKLVCVVGRLREAYQQAYGIDF